MAVRVLLSKAAIEDARRELRGAGACCIDPWFVGFLRRLGFPGRVPVGDRLKSWDVLATAAFLLDRLPKSVPVLDIGAYASEILPALHRLGFASLAGIDLNPGIRKMPFPDAIRYEIGDFLQTPFRDGSFGAVTAVSVMEHGFDAPRLLAEISRLLRPGGYFISSFDYWPEKIDTNGITMFGMEWTIFSRGEVLRFLADARGHGLEPVGEIDLDAGERVVRSGGKEYTFGWLALRRTG